MENTKNMKVLRCGCRKPYFVTIRSSETQNPAAPAKCDQSHTNTNQTQRKQYGWYYNANSFDELCKQKVTLVKSKEQEVG